MKPARLAAARRNRPTRARPRPQLHASALQMFAKCAAQFEHRYVHGRKVPPGVFKVVGTATDRAAMADLSNKIAAHVLLEEEAVAQIAADTVHQEWSTDIVLDDEPINGKDPQAAAVDKAVRLARGYHKLIAPDVEPIEGGLQHGFALQMDGILTGEKNVVSQLDLVGTSDVLEAKKIRDIKTTAKSKSQLEADTSLQLSTYAMARTVETGETPLVQLDVLVDLKGGVKPQLLTSSRNEQDFEQIQRRVVMVARALKTGIFPPTTPDAWWCSARWCGFHSVCPHAVKPRSVAVAENLWEAANAAGK